MTIKIKTGSNKTEKHHTETLRLDREQRAGKTQCSLKDLNLFYDNTKNPKMDNPETQITNKKTLKNSPKTQSAGSKNPGPHKHTESLTSSKSQTHYTFSLV